MVWSSRIILLTYEINDSIWHFSWQNARTWTQLHFKKQKSCFFSFFFPLTVGCCVWERLIWIFTCFFSYIFSILYRVSHLQCAQPQNTISSEKNPHNSKSFRTSHENFFFSYKFLISLVILGVICLCTPNAFLAKLIFFVLSSCFSFYYRRLSFVFHWNFACLAIYEWQPWFFILCAQVLMCTNKFVFVCA